MASIRDFEAAEPEEIEDEPWERHIDALYEKRCDSALMGYDAALGLDLSVLAATMNFIRALWLQGLDT